VLILGKTFLLSSPVTDFGYSNFGIEVNLHFKNVRWINVENKLNINILLI